MLAEYTEASRRALEGLRDIHMLKWYAVPLFGLVVFTYVKEIKRAREGGNWDPILAALVLFGCDFFNETWNGWVFHLSKRSAVWTTPGDTAYRVMVGWNLEIIFIFALFGLAYYHSLLPEKEKRILGLPNRWFFALFYSVVAVVVEVILNAADLLVWEYPWWYRSFGGIWLIFLLGYFYWFAAINFMLDRRTLKGKLAFTGAVWAVPVALNILGAGILGFRY